MPDAMIEVPARPSVIRGGCLCGAVRYSLTGQVTLPNACHCHMCRRHHGALGVFIGAKRAAIELKGADNILWFQSSPGAERGSCKICGSKLFWRQTDGEAMDATVGSLDRQADFELQSHIWVEHRGNYEVIADNLPKFSASMQGEGDRQPIMASPVATPLGSDRQSGGCLCGALRFEIAGNPTDVVTCHCAQCQHWHGDAGVYISIDRTTLTMANEAELAWYRSSPGARRGFCTKCGACMFWQRLQNGQPAGQISVSVGALDAPTGLRLTRHLFPNDQTITGRLIDQQIAPSGLWAPSQSAF
jgi:hypothetical protein